MVRFLIIDILLPKRPSWNYSMTKNELESKEEAFFQKFLNNLKSQPFSDKLAHFEHNLEVYLIFYKTWRQLWRVLEKSDIITMLADSRFPVFCICYRFCISFLHCIIM